MNESKFLHYAQTALRFISVSLMALALWAAFLVIVQSVFCPFHAIASDSMLPSIKTGDAVLIKDIDARNVNVGEVIIFFDPVNRGTLVIHRVVDKNFVGDTPVYTTKGDNNPVADPVGITPTMIVGTPSRNIPGFGSMLNFLTTSKGYMRLVVIPGALSFIIAFALAVVERFFDPKTEVIYPGREFKVAPTYCNRKLMNLQ
ncbi:MAG: signal peptidase I [Actinobacteria bacterium]|nr:signal peptidase I [Actinomycetota bacterium]